MPAMEHGEQLKNKKKYPVGTGEEGILATQHGQDEALAQAKTHLCSSPSESLTENCPTG